MPFPEQVLAVPLCPIVTVNNCKHVPFVSGGIMCLQFPFSLKHKITVFLPLRSCTIPCSAGTEITCVCEREQLLSDVMEANEGNVKGR